MNAKEACKLVLANVPGTKALKCYEYDSLYVFMIVPASFDESKPIDRLIDCLRSINKKTGEIRDFKPFYIPIEEYRNGKEIANFK